MTTKPQHTPTPPPWNMRGTEHGSHTEITKNGNVIGVVFNGVFEDGSCGEANAVYVVRAVNSHDKLLKLARELRDICLKNGTDYKGIDEAIAKAQGGK